MAKTGTARTTLRRMAAFKALGRAVTAGARGGPSLGARLGALPRMIAATVRGKYDGGARTLAMAAAAAYIVSPIDLIPEGLFLALGLGDDAIMVAWLAGAVLSETERFLAWEARRDAIVPGEVVG
ncbi:YkvA family protein [Pilimelia columellifera]|uniref:DUF1232 domain-containing protein n=1 Tax=Pilimelia columellifera subsp. columellifera TaxID=706583 RepID=A0ABP6AVI6_9ACTN